MCPAIRVLEKAMQEQWLRTLFAVVGLLFCPAMVRAQAHGDINVSIDAAGTCPGQDELLRLNPALGDDSPASLSHRIMAPMRAGSALHRSNTLDSPIAGVSLGFDDDVEVLSAFPVDPAQPVLVRLVRDRGPLCGWINVWDLERYAAPMQLRSIPGLFSDMNQGGWLGRQEARVVVKSRIDRQTGYAQHAPLFNAPFTGVEESAGQRRGLSSFDVLSVFEVKSGDGWSDCRTFRDANCFLRVGTPGSLLTAGHKTHGWVRGTDVEFWPSNLAIYYGPGKQGLKIHRTLSSALIGTPFAPAGAKEEILAYQPEGPHKEPRERNIARFPVLRATPFVEPGARRAGPAARSATSYVYEILLHGQACIEDPARGRAGCVPEPAIRGDIARFSRAVTAISNVDVLFVISAADGMARYYSAITSAIRRFVERASSDRGVSFRYSIVLYGDHNRNVASGLDYFALPFSADISGLEPLARAGSYDDENKDKAAAPFAALERAVSTAQWRPEAAQRLIVWIGNYGNRPAGKHTTAAGALVEDRTARTVVEAIQAGDRQRRDSSLLATKTRFAAIQVRGGERDTRQPDFEKFSLDAEAIRQGLGENVFKTTLVGPNQTVKQETAALVTSISRHLDQTLAAIAAILSFPGETLGGDANAGTPTGPAALLSKDVLAELGFPPERLAEMGRRIQLVQTGFVFQSARNPDYRYWLGLRHHEFADVAMRVRQLCENLVYSDRLGYVEGTMISLARAVTDAEPQSDESIRGFYSRILSLPVTTLPPLLNAGSPVNFVRTWHSSTPAQREAILAAVCKGARRLAYIGDGEMVDEHDLVFDPRRNRVSLRGAAPKHFDWRWISPDGRRAWFFIPLDVLP
jgi:hypothetical protein